MLNRQEILDIVPESRLPRHDTSGCLPVRRLWCTKSKTRHGILTSDAHTPSLRPIATHIPRKKPGQTVCDPARFPPYVEIFEEWTAHRIVIKEGLPLASLEDIIRHKQQLSRPKDLRDLALIDTYYQHCSAAS